VGRRYRPSKVDLLFSHLFPFIQNGANFFVVLHQSKKNHEVVIVGAGMAGLTCAYYLRKAGRSVYLVEASDRVGGRLQTDLYAGYRLDRGFQVLLTSYPEAKLVLNYDRLNLHELYPGATIRFNGQFYEMADPFRQPLKIFKTLSNPIGSINDKIKVGLLRLGLLSTKGFPDESSTKLAIQSLGFTESMQQHFWRPFLAGVFLEPELRTSVRKFDEVFTHFANGSTSVPSLGVAEIPKQLAEFVGNDQLMLNTKAEKVSGESLLLSSGQILNAKVIVIATDQKANCALTETDMADEGRTGVACIYYAIDKPISQPGRLILNGDSKGPINNLMVMPEEAEYAPKGKYLISASVVKREYFNDADLDQLVRSQLREWYDVDPNELRHLKTYLIPNPVPATPLPRDERDCRIRTGLYRCGDYMGVPSLNTAMRSGRLVAEQIIREG
tara:strand:- start:110 stop:1435 length:1326 start_codon:yes stop_codon:yes gene_type:complete